MIEAQVNALEFRVAALESHVRRLEALRSAIAYELAADVTFTRDDLLFRHYINCSTSCAITLPLLETGEGVMIRNTGTQTLTIKDSGGSTIGTVGSGSTSQIAYDGTSTLETEF